MFRVTLVQASKNWLRDFRLGFGKQAVSFCKVHFFWLAFYSVKSGSQNRLQGFAKVLASLVQVFQSGLFFSGKVFFVKSIFQHGFQ